MSEGEFGHAAQVESSCCPAAGEVLRRLLYTQHYVYGVKMSVKVKHYKGGSKEEESDADISQFYIPLPVTR